jgi:hypothetical protein
MLEKAMVPLKNNAQAQPNETILAFSDGNKRLAAYDRKEENVLS